ncbi:ABC transporter permease [Murimonas intestini]|uniref:Aldotetraouronic acid ABC transporter membrane protein 1 /aldotetraouronic acid ABC transporter membrane protein 1 n=1 Tax=Murimonas intestini TaxID=1337051 RepID=A0AB73T3I4_9FIRM|nr:ABC transporter permease subunit [Murimonas intestini]MCR1841553.1 ABC transporter permease subunit [Murimonas intestini]MCR1867059.1 ABC transporter permease subunit [Murimonas intestini]MCR1884082.1 ABC transporter permease subunit [Murimonas intestini]
MRKKKKMTSDQMMFHLMVWIPLLCIIIFNYIPMITGFSIAFKDYKPGLGIADSPWVGLKHFEKMFITDDTLRALRNTLIIAFMKIIGNLAVPITFALMLNEIRVKWFKKMTQTITYLPYFLSWIILAGILTNILRTDGGLVNRIIEAFGHEPVFFLGSNDTFRWTLTVSDVWKNFGYNTIVYLAALTNIDPALYEAAAIDGAGRWKQTLHITLPGISMFIVLMTILSIGNILNAGFDQVFNLYNVSVYESGDIIDTLVYRLGIQQQQYSFSTAVGLFKSVVSIILIAGSNKLADKFAGYRVF